MNMRQRRVLIWVGLSSVVIAGLILAFRPQAVPVDTATVKNTSMVVTVDDEGQTRIRDVFVLSAPIAGRMLRIDAEVGDVVEADKTVIAEIEPLDPDFLDPRSKAQAQADLQAAIAAKNLAQAELDHAKAEFEFADLALQRAQRLILNRTISQHALDEAHRAFKTRKATIATAKASLNVRNFELARAKARLISPTETQEQPGACECVTLRAPISGQILRVLHESERVVRAGEALVEIGDPDDLEIIVDFLSTDAVKMRPGQRVIIEQWGGDRPLGGQLRRVEPYGFTKVSALGIEEQRVNVIIDFIDSYEQWSQLGHGYQVEVRVVLWEAENVLAVPLAALFREEERWSVFVAKEGRASLRIVDIGRHNDLLAQVVGGLNSGEMVVLYPSDRVFDSVQIDQRESSGRMH